MSEREGKKRAGTFRGLQAELLYSDEVVGIISGFKTDRCLTRFFFFFLHSKCSRTGILNAFKQHGHEILLAVS